MTGALVLGGATAFAVRYRKKKKAIPGNGGTTPGNGGTTPPGNGGGGGGGPVGPQPCNNAVGDPTFTDWPYKSRWGSPLAFGLRLQEMQYSPGNIHSGTWVIYSDEARSAIRNFQRDYNKVRLTINDPPPKLSIDGCIGPETARAFKRAEDWANLGGMSWKQLVAAS